MIPIVFGVDPVGGDVDVGRRIQGLAVHERLAEHLFVRLQVKIPPRKLRTNCVDEPLPGTDAVEDAEEDDTEAGLLVLLAAPTVEYAVHEELRVAVEHAEDVDEAVLREDLVFCPRSRFTREPPLEHPVPLRYPFEYGVKELWVLDG